MRNPANGSLARSSSRPEASLPYGEHQIHNPGKSLCFEQTHHVSFMRHFWNLADVKLSDSWLTIGSFDGVHLGHQAIVRKLASGARAAGSPAVVLTFFPHPSVVLGKRKDPFYLTTSEERAALLGESGADVVITHPFDLQVAATTAVDFISRLKQQLGIAHLLVGYDFALGRDREGDVPALRKFGEEFGYTLETMPAVEINGEVVSSSRIRAALVEGAVQKAAQLLGRPYRISGQVIAGDGRGRSIGIPTANLEVWAERVIPKSGVYVCQALAGGKTWGAVSNIGVRPTFETQPVPARVEAHILDFDTQIYGEEIRLDFLARLRDEQRFPDVQALVAQIHQDIQRAREYFFNNPVP
jgi:riboflavin kinase/FMN adenylyltransferase